MLTLTQRCSRTGAVSQPARGRSPASGLISEDYRRSHSTTVATHRRAPAEADGHFHCKEFGASTLGVEAATFALET